MESREDIEMRKVGFSPPPIESLLLMGSLSSPFIQLLFQWVLARVRRFL